MKSLKTLMIRKILKNWVEVSYFRLNGKVQNSLGLRTAKEEGYCSLMVLSRTGLSYYSVKVEYNLGWLTSLAYHFLLEVNMTVAVELIAYCHSTFQEEYIAVGSAAHGQVRSEPVAFAAEQVFPGVVADFLLAGQHCWDCDKQGL